MIELTVEQKIISITVEQTDPITLTSVSGGEVSFVVMNGNVLYSAGLNVYSIILTQIDVDNKFVFVNTLSNLINKENTAVIIENVGLHLEYGVDYVITIDNKIYWSGYQLDGKLSVGDKIKVYY